MDVTKRMEALGHAPAPLPLIGAFLRAAGDCLRKEALTQTQTQTQTLNIAGFYPSKNYVPPCVFPLLVDILILIRRIPLLCSGHQVPSITITLQHERERNSASQ